jgi:hypothetical protein
MVLDDVAARPSVEAMHNAAAALCFTPNFTGVDGPVLTSPAHCSLWLQMQKADIVKTAADAVGAVVWRRGACIVLCACALTAVLVL